MSDTAIEYERGLTFEKVWLMFQETDRLIRELREESKETDRRMQETDHLIRELREESKETDRLIKELSKNVGGVNNTLGSWAEETVAANLSKKFNALGYNLTETARNKLFTKDGQTFAEVDILLENGKYIMPVEVKATLTVEDIDGHLKRLGRVRECLDLRGEKRRVIGAVAGMITSREALRYAQDNGLYVVMQSGDSAEIAPAPEGFTPRVW
ncbi:MAG: hypothetical protein LBH75_05085 [Treponema sp.]|jgi:hypothetical protein|nr:hypothetical protein [Treponema sp.]